jgi:WD40 repeat protein
MQQMNFQRITDFKLPTLILGASWIDSGKSLVAGCMDGVYVIDIETKKYDRIGTHDSYVSSVAALPSEGIYVTAGYDGAIQWFSRDERTSTRRVLAHNFWSWDMAVSADGKLLASVTGQYLAGGYKYEPASELEPSVRVFDVLSGELRYSFNHVPSVQAVAFSHNSQYLAAGNLLGEVRIWDCQTGQLINAFTTKDFTSWGIIKSHCYLGGVFGLKFAPDDESILICGMGEMRDPMAGNGRQLWQQWSWRDQAKKLAETKKEEAGEGLMETLALHPNGDFFAMGGRLRGTLAPFAPGTGLGMRWYRRENPLRPVLGEKGWG